MTNYIIKHFVLCTITLGTGNSSNLFHLATRKIEHSFHIYLFIMLCNALRSTMYTIKNVVHGITSASDKYHKNYQCQCFLRESTSLFITPAQFFFHALSYK